MSRRGWIVLAVLALLLVPGYFISKEISRGRHLMAFLELSDALDADLAEYEAATRRRPPLREPAEDGSAEVHYQRAVELLVEEGSFSEVPPLMPTADFAEYVRLHGGAVNHIVTKLSRGVPALEALSAGTRTTKAGVFRTPRDGSEDEYDRVEAEKALTYLMVLDAGLAASAQNEERALERLEELLRFGLDTCVGDTYSAWESTALVTGLGLSRRMAEAADLSPAAVDRVFAAVSEFVSLAPSSSQVWFRGSLHVQVGIRGVLIGATSYEDLHADDPGLWPAREKRMLGLASRGPDDDELLAAWRRLRADIGALQVAVTMEGAVGKARVLSGIQETARSESGSFYAGVLARVIVPGNLAIDQFARLKREAEGVLLGLAALRHQRRTGDWPETIEEFRPPEVPESPDGGTWLIELDRGTGKPVIRLEGGLRYSYESLKPGEGNRHRAPGHPQMFRFR